MVSAERGGRAAWSGTSSGGAWVVDSGSTQSSQWVGTTISKGVLLCHEVVALHAPQGFSPARAPPPRHAPTALAFNVRRSMFDVQRSPLIPNEDERRTSNAEHRTSK